MVAATPHVQRRFREDASREIIIGVTTPLDAGLRAVVFFKGRTRTLGHPSGLDVDAQAHLTITNYSS